MAEAQPVPVDPVAGLIDIPSPPAISLWPQTWTSRIAIVVALVVVLVAAWRFLHRRWLNRYRRAALAELDRIEGALEANAAPARVAADLALLVRRTALAAFPRQQVAALAGTDWLSFLDRSYGGDEFCRGAGQVLASAPYECVAPAPARLRRVLDLVRRWIKVHHD